MRADAPLPRDTRSRLIMIRLTEEEREVLTAAARRAGLGLGPWLRSLGMREAGAYRPET